MFSSLHINASLEIPHKYGIPANIAKARIDDLSNTIKRYSRGHHGQPKAALIKQLAKSTIGDKDKLYVVQIRLCNYDTNKLAVSKGGIHHSLLR